MKEFWLELKKSVWVSIVLIVIGFCGGKIYTYDSIIADCKIVGAFRVLNTAFACRINTQ